MQDTVKERLIKFIKYKGLSQKRFELSVGLPNGYVNNIVSSVTQGKLQKISLQYPELNKGWLLTGDGEMLNTSADDKSTKDGIPFYENIPTSGGQYGLAGMIAEEIPTRYINFPGLPSASFAFPVIGCSMEPTIKQGDIIAVTEMNKWDIVDPDKVYLIITRDERMIKHLIIDNENDEILWCMSDNASYSKFKIYKSDIRQIYRVVFHGHLL